MATAHADARQQSDLRADRPPLPPRSDRRPPPPLPPLPELPGRGRPARGAPAGPRERSAERVRAERPRPADREVAARVRADRSLRDDLDRARPPAPRDPALPSRPIGREDGRPRKDDVRAARAARPSQPSVPQPVAGAAGSGRLRGLLAVVGVFLVTLAGAAADWYLGSGLGLITLVALVASTAIGVLLVHRRDMLSVVLAPPLVFVGVAGLNIALSPSVDLSLPTAVTLMIRGFPTMAVATAAAVVLCLIRLSTRR